MRIEVRLSEIDELRIINLVTGLQALDQLSTSSDGRLRKFGAVLLLLLLGYWTYQLLRSYPGGQTPWIFLDNLNLVFHEAGHWLWSPLGQFWAIAGGSLTQILIPMAVMITFIWQRDLLGIGFGLFWIGNNLINVSYYIADAQARVLPLLGGEASIHDWNWLLVELGWLDKAEMIGLGIKITGGGVLLLSIGCLMLAILSMKANRVSV